MFELPKTVLALERAAIETGEQKINYKILFELYKMPKKYDMEIGTRQSRSMPR
jgi:hypothetical protein